MPKQSACCTCSTHTHLLSQFQTRPAYFSEYFPETLKLLLVCEANWCSLNKKFKFVYVLPSNSQKENAPLQFLFKGSIDEEKEDDVFPSMTSFLLISMISLSYKVINMDWLAILNSYCVAFFSQVSQGGFLGAFIQKKIIW